MGHVIYIEGLLRLLNFSSKGITFLKLLELAMTGDLNVLVVLLMYILQLLVCYMGVNLGRGNITVAQKLLNTS